MTTSLRQLGSCYSPELGEGTLLRPDFWGQHDSITPFVSGEQV